VAEDPLRELRAIRFAAACRLEFEPALAQALPAAAPLLAGLSAERAGAELTAMFTGAGRGRALRLLIETGAAAAVLPEAIRMTGVPQPAQFHPEGDVLTHVCLVLAQVPAGDPVLAWSAVLHDIGKPATFERAEDRIRFSRHDVVSADLAAQILRRLRIGRETRERVVAICRDHIRIASLPQMAPPRAERWMRDPGFAAHLEFHRADCTASHGLLDIHAWARRALDELPPLPPPPLCTGRDVLALGVPAGPVVGRVLAELDEAVATGEIQDRDAALSRLRLLVERIVKTSGPDGR
jgi:poly(A) polymerase